MSSNQKPENSVAGNHGEGVRSDCLVNLELKTSGGIQLKLNSKVHTLYGDQIAQLCEEILQCFEIKNAILQIDDSGALPFVIAARLEAAIKKQIRTESEFLLPILEQNKYYTPRDKDRVSRLYLPGNNPKLLINAGIYGSNGIILDLEDSVTPEKKNEARFLVRNALRSVDFYGVERMVRINQLPGGLDDLDFCVNHYVNVILIPKCEKPEQVVATDKKISEILKKENDCIHLMPILESALGIVNAYAIATASRNVVAVAIGLEDYTADLGVQRTNEGSESLYARYALVNAAVAAGVQPIDSVFSDIADMEALLRQARLSRSMGFTGMGCIHPRQIPFIHEGFMPTVEEINKAQRIVMAFNKAQEEGKAVVTVYSKMIDPPVVKRAFRTIEAAGKAGLLTDKPMEKNG